jgi:hypothetical protein
MARKLKDVENETLTLFEMEYHEKHRKTWKMRNAHCRNSNMAIKLTNEENEKLT